MRALRYTNVLLTLIAVLLGLHLWTWWSSGAGPGTAAWAAPEPAPSGILNASAQRKEAVDLLKLQNRKLDELVTLFKTGQAKVIVDDRSEKKDGN